MISWTITIVILNEAVCPPFPCLAFNRLGNDAQIIFFFHNLFFFKSFFPFPLCITFQYKTGNALVVPITYVLQYITVMEVVQPLSHFLFCLSLFLSLVSFLIFSWGQVTVPMLSNTISIKVTSPLTPSNKQAPSLGSKSCFSFRGGMQWISSPCVWSKVIKNCTTVLKI